MHIRESFYKGKETTEAEFLKNMVDADSINLVGKKTVGLALKNNWIKKEDIIPIDGVPHAQIFKL